MAICKHCKMSIPEGAKICPYCRKKISASIGVKILLGILCMGGLLSAVANSNAPPQSSQPTKTAAQKEADISDYLVRYASAEFLKMQLKAPSTADMPDIYDLTVTPVKNKPNTWTVTGVVDAQNSYGAKIRTHFKQTIQKGKSGDMAQLNIKTW